MSTTTGAIGRLRTQARRLAALVVIGAAPWVATPALSQPALPQGSFEHVAQTDIYALYDFGYGCLGLTREQIERRIKASLANREVDERGQASIGFEYTLRPIVLLVANGNDAEIERRTREAEALRARFDNCDQGLRLARALRNVVVRDPVRRNSADLPPHLRKILDDMMIGHLTSPEVTRQGIEVFALCARTETTIQRTLKLQVRDELSARAELVLRDCDRWR